MSRTYGRNRSLSNGYDLTGSDNGADEKRNVWEVAGYPTIVNFHNHWNMFTRFGIAKAGIIRIVNKCWQVAPTITDGEYKKDEERPQTKFEKDLSVLIEKHQLFTRLKGLDKRQRVGRYGGIIPIVKEPIKTKPEEPMSKLRGVDSVLKLLPVYESQIDTNQVNTISDLSDPNYGSPEYYNFREDVNGDRNPLASSSYELNATRVFAYAEGADDGSIFGVPANEAGYNDLLTLEKIIASGGEGHFKNAKQRVVYNVKDSQIASSLANKEVDPKTGKTKKESWDENNDRFHSGFDTSMILYGMDAQTLQSTLSDPTAPFTIALNSYCASIECPVTILIGQQTGRLASDEDNTAWNGVAEARCNNELTPMIKSFIDYMVKIGALTAPNNEVVITWPDFSEPRQTDKLEVASKMAEINKKAYDAGRQDPVFSESEIRKASGHEESNTDDMEDFTEEDEEIGENEKT